MKPHPLDTYRGCWALVTGSARPEGLGFAFARELAARGINLALIDILDQELHARAGQLQTQYGINVLAIPADLGDLESFPRIQDALHDVDVEILVCDHMYTPKETPEILDMELAVHNRMIDINARAYTNLIHRFGQSMRDKRKGAIIIVSSGAGLTPTAYTGAYAANKAFQIALGEALWYELRPHHVDVLVVVAGLMNTQGDAFAKYPQWQIADRNDVAAQTLRTIGRKHLIAPGRVNHVTVFVLTRLMSRRRAITQTGRFMAAGLSKGRQP